jgi:S-DNA-T family DNA segregation ATPase FtsK/SpoIIIE
MQGLWFLPSVIFGAFQGFTSGNWQMMAFALLSVGVWPLTVWIRRHREFTLDGVVSFDGKDVWIGEHRLPRQEILWRKSWHQVVWDGLALQTAQLSRPDLLRSARSRGFLGAQQDYVWLGLEKNQDYEFNLPEGGPHLLVIGATGTGKSELLRLLISGWLNLHSPTELTLIDFKGGATMARFAEHPRVVGLATDLKTTDALSIANTLEQQLVSRQAALAESGAENIEAFWRSGRALPRRIVVIDELGELLRQHPRLAQVLEQITARGRSLGVHLVVANQSLAGVSRGLLVNLRARIAIGEMDPIDLNQLGFRSKTNHTSSMPGWRSAKFRNGNGGEHDFTFPIGF